MKERIIIAGFAWLIIRHSSDKGKPVIVLSADRELTPNQAAAYLGISRPFLLRLLDNGVIPQRHVGTHRRIKLQDVQAFKAEAERLDKIMDELVAQVTTLPENIPSGFPRKRFTVQECCFLVENGLLEAGKFELIEGDIVSKTGQGRAHIAVITHILRALIAIFGIDQVQCQAPIGIGALDPNNDPEPDAAVLRRFVDEYLEQEPVPAIDVLLVVEASSATLTGDLTTKASLYARHGVPEYWVVDIENRSLVVFRQPGLDGYASRDSHPETATVAPLPAPQAVVRVADLLP